MMYPKTVLGFLVVGMCAGAAGVAPDDPVSHFQNIHRRNVFGLTNPPANVAVVQPPQLPKLLLTGIATVPGNKRALLKAMPPGADKSPTTGKELSLMLTEGQRDGEIEVLQIDEKAGAVKVSNSGRVMTLTFEKDGPKLPATPLPTPGGTQPPGGTTLIPGLPTAYPPIPAPTGYTNLNTRPMPTRTQRLPYGASAPHPFSSPPGAQPSAPAAPVPNPANAAPIIPQQDLTPEEHQALVEAQQQISQSPAALPAPMTGGSGTFTTPPQEGILPAVAPPSPATVRERANP